MGVQMAYRTLEYHEQQYLKSRLGCQWEALKPGGVMRTCKHCGRRSKGWSAVPAWRRRDVRRAEELLCPKRKKPHRWRLAYRRWVVRQQAELNPRRPWDAAGLMTEILACEAAAARLPQTMENWAGHPIARRYRRLVRRWWALPVVPMEVAQRSPSWGHTLTGATEGRKDYFRARTILDNAIEKVQEHTWRLKRPWDDRHQYQQGKAPGELADLVQKAAHALRKIRPDLFEVV